MPAQILVVDSVAANRIVLKVKLGALRHNVAVAADVDEAERRIRACPPDLILCGLPHPEADVLRSLSRLRQAADPLRIPLLVLGALAGPEARIACLAGGADAILPLPVHDVVLFARIRALLRVRATESEVRLQREVERSLGLAEEEEPWAQPPRVIVASGERRREALSRALPGSVSAGPLRGILPPDPGARTPDLIVIDAGDMPDATIAGDIFRVLADLRSRDTVRRAAQLLILPDSSEELAAIALDLGVDDLVHAGVAAEELRLRAQRLLERKRRSDSLRDSLNEGLLAAVTDPLTGLYNRRYALPELRRLAARQEAAWKSFAVLLLDLDHFKRVNDHWGHGAGDRVLTEVADRLRGALSPADVVARIGGEEFLVLLPDSDADRACATAHDLCRIVEATPFTGDGKISLTTSIGIALGGRGTDAPPETLLERADRALYEAKHSGRNRVSVSAA